MSLRFYSFPEIFENGLWANLSPSAKALYPVLLKFANLKTKLAFPSRETAMKISGIKKPHSFSKARKELEAKGLVSKSWLAPCKGGGFRRKLFFQMPSINVPERHMPDAINGRTAIIDATKGRTAIKDATNGHIERSEREERNPALKRPPLTSEKADFADSKGTGLTAYPKPLLDDLARKYGAAIVEDGIRQTPVKFVRYPVAYLRKTCESIAYRKREERIEREAAENKQKYRTSAKEDGSILERLGLNPKSFGAIR